MANLSSLQNSSWRTNVCADHKRSIRKSAVPAVANFYASFAPFSEVWSGAVHEVSRNNRLSANIVANAEFTRRSRKKPQEPKSKDAISRNSPVSPKPAPALTTDFHDKNKVRKEQDVIDLDSEEVNQLSQEAQHVVVAGGKKNLQKKNIDVERDVIENRKAKIGAEASEREKSQFHVNQKVQAGQDVAAAIKQREAEELLKKQILEKEKSEAWKRELERLANENSSLHNKVFFYPIPAEAGQEIEIYFDRSITTLANEPKVLIMGAFNDWRWNSFMTELQKCELSGDWWTCKLSIPKEVYCIDFVFFNGREIYENNNKRDFSIAVEGGMDKQSFEEFLLEEKRRELERLAAEESERERKAAEQRRLEEEKVAMEADRAEAKKQAVERQEQTRRVLQKAVKSVDGLWRIEPVDFKGGDRVKLYYNRTARPLAFSSDVWIHGGYNNWQDALFIVHKLFYDNAEDGDWWSVDVVVPDRAFMLDWVFADGPPGNAKVYDNNNYQDFHAIVPKSIPKDLCWVEEEQQIFLRLQQERHEREEAARRKAEKIQCLKDEMKKKTMKRFLESQKHVFYTEPMEVQAGKSVTIFYNPSNTVLNGKAEVWIRCSFNRWTHRLGVLPPQKMIPAENGSHVKATVKVPLDTYMMDFVFSERGDEHGGLYDNRNGIDYHVPVVGGILREPPMHIVHIAVEMAPIAKVGGLGDVVTSLSRAVQDLGHNVEIICPKYDCLNHSHVRDLQFRQEFSWEGAQIKVWHGKVEGLSVYFIEPNNGMFWVGCIYGRKDDGQRFGFFCNAALEFLRQSGSHPDIIHCHDWSSAPVAGLFQEHYKHYGLANARIVFTIHNLEFEAALIGKAMAHAHKATTVSYTYAQEISGNPAIAPHRYKFHGILNGIDPVIWDPFNDPFIPVGYTKENVVEGKRAAKEELQHRLGLKQVDRPLVGIITRLTAQKGVHLIKHAISRTLDRSGQVVLLGSAPDPRIQNDFNNLANQLRNTNGDMARLCLTYDEPLSHLIYAGADFILVPSIFEPCGLTQLTAMRYGAIPVVRKTGGLNDTVFDVDHERKRAEEQGLELNGFSFEMPDASGLDYALNRALSAWYENRDWFYSLCKQVMDQDWSWNRPALDYMELYYCARK
uniref:starch synthase n=1 Tax=Wollemia nobilis TaxID=56998 RepID=A0A0C9RME5_9CONI